MDDAELATRALRLLDLTDLSETCTAADIDRLVEKARTPHGPVAAICIWLRFVDHAATRLQGAIPIATVVNFPDGGADVETTLEEVERAMADGADEIDLVLPYRAFLAGEEPIARSMVAEVRDILHEDVVLKVILETGAFPDGASIRAASLLAIEEGASFIKTSTGKIKVSATPDAARAMLEAIRESGAQVGFKPSGGIRTLADAATYLSLADAIMGEGWATPERFRFGASGIYDVLIAAIEGRTGAAARTGY
jgi:deoxyribose-phosphate aldolase